MSNYISEESLEVLIQHYLDEWEKSKVKKPHLLLQIVFYVYVFLAILTVPVVLISSVLLWPIVSIIRSVYEKEKNKTNKSTSQSSESRPKKENI